MHSVPLSACLLCKQLQVVATVCRCNASDSQALLKCLREKSSLELLNLGKVRRDGKSWRWVTQKMEWPNILSLLFVLIGDFGKRGDSWQHLSDVEFRTLTSDLRWDRDVAQPGLLLRH